MKEEVGNVDLLLGYIVQFANAVELYQKRNCNCFWVWQPRPPGERLSEEMGKTTRKVGLNLKEGTVKKGGQSSQKLVVMQEATPGNTPRA